MAPGLRAVRLGEDAHTLNHRRRRLLKIRFRRNGGDAGREVGKILGIAVRPGVREPMRPLDRATVIKDAGLEGDVPANPDRGITFLSSVQWQEVTRLLGTVLLWHTRRANVLVECDSLAHLIGKTIKIGPIIVAVKGESEPCALMDEIRPGLRDVLTPDCRGGVFGRVIEGGVFSVGDVITLWPGAA